MKGVGGPSHNDKPGLLMMKMMMMKMMMMMMVMMMMMMVMTMMMPDPLKRMVLKPPTSTWWCCPHVGFRSHIIGGGSVRICERVTYEKGRGRKWKAGPATMTSRAYSMKRG